MQANEVLPFLITLLAFAGALAAHAAWSRRRSQRGARKPASPLTYDAHWADEDRDGMQRHHQRRDQKLPVSTTVGAKQSHQPGKRSSAKRMKGGSYVAPPESTRNAIQRAVDSSRRELSSKIRGLGTVAYVALIISLAGNGILGFLMWKTNARLENSQDMIAHQVDEAERELTALAAAALSQMPDVSKLHRDLSALENKLWGNFGVPPTESDALGRLDAEIETLRDCFNRSLSASFDSFERSLYNEYSSSYWVSSC